MERYIGLDVHSQTCTCVVLGPTGRRAKQVVVETRAKELRELLRSVRRPSVLVMEEGNQSEWLFEVLSPHVTETLVVQPKKRTRTRKNDLLDAERLARLARSGEPGCLIFKAPRLLASLRQAERGYATTQKDLTRCRIRLKQLMLSRGVHAPSQELLAGPEERERWIARLPEGTHARARILGAMVDAMSSCHDDARALLLKESRGVRAIKWVKSVPGIGPIRAAQVVSAVISPHRFRTKRQLWAYSRLAVLAQSSSDWVPDGRGHFMRRERELVLGLNRNGNAALKSAFVGAAQQVINHMKAHPLRQGYARRIERGMKPSNARLTLARQLAAITLAVWKKEELYDLAKT